MKRLFVIFLAGLVCTIARAQAPTDTVLDASLREEVVSVEKSGFLAPTLKVTYHRPPGDGPFPWVIINHGKEAGDTRFQARARYPVVARELVARGYAVVIPMRQGFWKSGGVYVDGGCNLYSNGLAQADDVLATLKDFGKRPELDPNKVLVFGQSHGGLTTLALGALNPPGVLGLVNFAGGLRNTSCINWESELAATFGKYGKQTRIPALFFYGDNNSFWSPQTWRAMASNYNESGGQAKVIAFGQFGQDAHGMFGPSSGLKIWLPEVEAFMQSLGLPYKPSGATPQSKPSPEAVDSNPCSVGRQSGHQSCS